MVRADDLLAAYPASLPLTSGYVAQDNEKSPSILVVLDDDPTGTQSVADVPVLTRWDVDEFRWAYSLQTAGRPAAAVYVLTNTRSLDPEQAAERNHQVVTAAVVAARQAGLTVEFVSRGDSTLRGHYPLEPDVIAQTLSELGESSVDGVVIVPAFPDAGRVTIGGEHYLLSGGELTPVSQTEFAQDATFGFSTSYLPAYIEERSGGRIRADRVIVLDLGTVRSGSEAIAKALEAATDTTPIVADIVGESDLRALALGLSEARRHGKSFIYRVGPPFVRARIGQEPREPLTREAVYSAASPSRAERQRTVGGLIVVGSHVGLTTRQLLRLTSEHQHARIIELDVRRLLNTPTADAYIAGVVDEVVDALETGDVILHTSRLLIRSENAAESLRIARTISGGVVATVNQTLHALPPRFVIAKGGITSSDVATYGLEMHRAIVRGPMLPGIVSVWESMDGPAEGIPYIVFAGNVGDDDSLLAVVRKLSAFLD